jgi:hypothetical protein
MGDKPEIQSLKIYKQKFVQMRLSLKYIQSYIISIFSITLILIIRLTKLCYAIQ